MKNLILIIPFPLTLIFKFFYSSKFHLVLNNKFAIPMSYFCIFFPIIQSKRNVSTKVFDKNVVISIA